MTLARSMLRHEFDNPHAHGSEHGLGIADFELAAPSASPITGRLGKPCAR